MSTFLAIIGIFFVSAVSAIIMSGIICAIQMSQRLMIFYYLVGFSFFFSCFLYAYLVWT